MPASLSVESCVGLPVPKGTCRGHSPIVGSVVYDPAQLVEGSLAFSCGGQLLSGLQERQLVDNGEMTHKAGLSSRVADEEDVFDLVAILAQGLESSQVLIACSLVILPDLMAVQTASTAACLAAIVSLIVDGTSDTIPTAGGQQVS